MDGWITRSEAASILKTTYQTILNLERSGKLQVRKSTEGVALVDAVTIEAMRRAGWRPMLGRPAGKAITIRSLGQLEAAIVKLIDEGKDARVIVRELSVPFEEVRRVYREYHETLDEGFISKDERNAKMLSDERERIAVAQENGKTTRATIALQKELVKKR